MANTITRVPADEPAWDTQQVARYLSVSERHIRDLRKKDASLPTPRTVGRRPRWCPVAVRRWIADGGSARHARAATVSAGKQPTAAATATRSGSTPTAASPTGPAASPARAPASGSGTGTPEDAEARAAELRDQFGCHIADEIGSVRCREAALWPYTAVFEQLAVAGASEAVVSEVARTLGAIRTFGFRHGCFADENTFGAAQQGSDLVADHRRPARIAQADDDGRISLDVCPTVDDVGEFTAALTAGCSRATGRS